MKPRIHSSSVRDPTQLQTTGAMLLLRSPRLPVSLILELLDIGDAEFRRMCAENRRIAELLAARRAGSLTLESPDVAECPECGDWFLPYGNARHCSDACREIARVRSAPRSPRPQ